MSDHNRRQDLAEGDILLSLFAPKVLEKAAFPAGVQVPAPVATPPVAQPSWVQRHQGPLALGGIGLAGALGGGALAYYKNQQEKKIAQYATLGYHIGKVTIYGSYSTHYKAAVGIGFNW
jgi:hypothetical protein